MRVYNLIFFILWGFVNSLFIIKYAPIPAWAGAFAGGILTLLTALFYQKRSSLEQFEKPLKIAWILSVLGTLTLQILLLIKVNRLDIDLDRWSAIQYFWDSLFNGEFPYAVKTHLQIHNTPSPLPIWMTFMLPFYFLGDVGILQPVVFIVVATVIAKLCKSYAERFTTLLLLIISPAFWYESLTRSDLLSCLILSLLVLTFIYRLGTKEKSWKRSLVIAVVLGLLMSTRAVLAIPAALVVASISRGNPKRFFGISLGAVPVFLLTLLPFYLWDSLLFMENNPLTLHSNKSVPGVVPMALMAALILGFKTVPFKKLMFFAGCLVFTVTSISFVTLFDEGSIVYLLHNNCFDITYFSMAFPFLFVGMAGRDEH